MLIRIAASSDIGRLREANEDHYCVSQFIEQGPLTSLILGVDSDHFAAYGALVAVADGMGGYTGGAFASRLALETLAAQFYAERREDATWERVAEQVERYLDGVRKVLSSRLSAEPTLAQAGTTLAGAVFLPAGRLVLFTVGDSRVFRVSGGYARQLTVDHTPVGADLAAGKMNDDDAIRSGALGLTRSFGAVGDSRADYSDVRAWDAMDTFILCSDGVSGVAKGIPTNHIETTVAANPHESMLAPAMVEEATRLDGRDNATAVVVKFSREGAL